MKTKLWIALSMSGLIWFAAYAQTFEKVAGVDMNGSFLCNYNDNLFFQASDTTDALLGLWKSDGTVQGTDSVFGSFFYVNNFGQGMSMVYNGKLYFEAGFDPFTYNLWVTDGTTNGTKMISNVVFSTPGYNSPNPVFTSYNGKLYFFAMDSTGFMTQSLWVSDGTPAGTQMVKSWPAFPTGYGPSTGITILNNKMYFGGLDSNRIDDELWSSDGTSVGTHIVSEESGPESFRSILYKGKIYYLGYTSAGTGLISSDGTPAGTRLLISIFPTGNYIVDNDKLYFGASDSTGIYGLWETDGTLAGTTLVKDHFFVENLAVFNNKLFFAGDDSIHGPELWTSDGTPDGTQMIKDIWSGKTGSSPYDFVEYSNKVYFMANDSFHGLQLYVTDGTTASTQMIAPYKKVPGNAVGTNSLIVYKGSLYFGANYYDSIYGHLDLWKLTTNVPEVVANGFSLYPNPVQGNYIYLQGDDFANSFQVQLFSIEGKMIFTQQFENPDYSGAIQVPLPQNLANSVYVLAVSTEQKTFYQKVVVQKQ